MAPDQKRANLFSALSKEADARTRGAAMQTTSWYFSPR